jgi:hypothetical protein
MAAAQTLREILNGKNLILCTGRHGGEGRWRGYPKNFTRSLVDVPKKATIIEVGLATHSHGLACPIL